jgi:hypothetical protein
MKAKTVEERLTQLEADLTKVAEAVITLRAGLAKLNPAQAPLPGAVVQPLVGTSRCR